METKAALYRAALQVVQQRRQKAEETARLNNARLRAAAPGYEPLRLQLLRAQIEQARLAAAGEPQQKAGLQVEKLRAELDALVASAGLTPAELEPCWSCPKCRDTGRADGKRCDCVEREMRAQRRRQINCEFPLNGCDFSSFSLDHYSAAVDAELGGTPREHMARVLEYCRAYADHFKPGLPSLLMMGNTGLGKTHLALAMAGCVLDRGFDVVYVSSQQAFAQLDAYGRDSEADIWLEAMLEADLLILDDLGTEYVVPHTVSVLYQIVNTRLCARRPTVYTTNITSQQLLNARYTEKVASRLLGGCEILQFVGDDIRLENK